MRSLRQKNKILAWYWWLIFGVDVIFVYFLLHPDQLISFMLGR